MKKLHKVIYALRDIDGRIVKVGQTAHYPDRPQAQLDEHWASYEILQELHGAAKEQIDQAELDWQETYGVVDSYNNPLRKKKFFEASGSNAYRSKDPNHINHCFQKWGPIRATREDGYCVIVRCNGDCIEEGINPGFVTRFLNGHVSRHKNWVSFEPVRTL